MKKLIATILAIVMCLSLVACGGPSGEQSQEPNQSSGQEGGETIKIGVLYPLSGSTATAGNSALWAVEWITDYINNELGGIQSMDGAKIELVVGDSKGDSQVGLTEFERMVNVENVSVMFGFYNTAVTNTLSQYCIANQVPAIATNAVGDEAFSQPNDYVFHANGCNATNTLFSNQRTEWMREVIQPMKKFAYVYDSADYGRESYETALANMEENGYEEIVGIPIEAGSADFSSQILQLKNDPEIEWVQPSMNMSDAILFVRQMKEYDVALPIFGNGGGFLQADFIEQAGDAADYVFSTSMWFPSMWETAWDTDFAQTVMDAYYEEFGYDFDESASCAWLGFWCVWDALERAGSADREAIAQAMAETDISGEHYATLLSGSKTVKFEDGEGAAGVMVYNQNFDTPVPWACIRDGEYRVVWPEELASQEYEFTWPIPSWDER